MGMTRATEFGVSSVATQHETVSKRLPEFDRKPVTPATEEERKAALAILHAFKRPEKRYDPHAVWRELKAREMRGERLTSYQRNAWREVLGDTPHSEPESDTPYKSKT